MASMQHEFIHPRQLDDVKAIRAAIKGFTTNMKRMMLLMKDVGTTLEQVSHSFDALTSLSFSDDGVKQYVHHFSEEVIHMMEGTAFQNYNKLVHEEVLVPVEQLRASLKETEKAASTEKSDFDRYKKAKQTVDKQEKAYATKSKSLDTSKSYPTKVQRRDDSLLRLQKSKDDFEVKFVGLVNEVEKVTATTLKRYLDLNAGYMTSVVDALTKTDPTVEEAVALYREELRQQRQSAIQQRCAEVDTEFNATFASQGYRLDPTGLSNSSRAQPNPNTVAAAARKPLSNTSLSAASSPVKPPAESRADLVRGPPTATTAFPNPAASTASAPASPPLQRGNSTQRGAFTVTTTAHGSPAVPPAASAERGTPTQHDRAPVKRADADAADRRAAVDVGGEEEEEEEDFGSVSQVGTGGKVAPPLYNFSRGPLSQVSSVRPQSGYVAAANANLTNDFLRKMESRSLTASEVCAARSPQQ